MEKDICPNCGAEMVDGLYDQFRRCAICGTTTTPRNEESERTIFQIPKQENSGAFSSLPPILKAFLLLLLIFVGLPALFLAIVFASCVLR